MPSQLFGKRRKNNMGPVFISETVEPYPYQSHWIV